VGITIINVIARIPVINYVTRIAIAVVIIRSTITDFVARITTLVCKQTFQPFAKCEFFTANIITAEIITGVTIGFIAGRTSDNTVTGTAVTCRKRTTVNKFFET
jgi:disulfide bond formation protein DsbB